GVQTCALPIYAVPFYVQETITLIFGTANQLTSDAAGAASLLEQTIGYWRKWVKILEPPPQWRDDVVRAAITLALNVYEPTGAIIPAMTTSIPEAPNTGRNWDYRYCWPRDGYFTAAALGRLGESRSAERFEQWGEQAVKLFDKPDAGLWELRGAARVHTFSSVMCWVACDRLAKFAERLQIGGRATHWRERADDIHAAILRRSWNADLNAFTATMEGDSLDASLLLMPRLG